jgi:hypothetical protein
MTSTSKISRSSLLLAAALTVGIAAAAQAGTFTTGVYQCHACITGGGGGAGHVSGFGGPRGNPGETGITVPGRQGDDGYGLQNPNTGAGGAGGSGGPVCKGLEDGSCYTD